MQQLTFLPHILLLTFFGALATLGILIPQRGKLVSFSLLVSSYIVFALMIFTGGHYSYSLTGLFFLGPVQIDLVLIASMFSLVITLFNGTQGIAYVKNSLITYFMFLGAVFVIGATEFVSFYLAIELMSLMGYVLVASSALEFSRESAVKYFIQGSINSSFLLLGMAFYFGATGNFDFYSVNIVNQHFYAVGITLMIVSAAFKLGVFPFHAWVPDVYSNVRRGTVAANFLMTKFVIGFVFLTLLQRLIGKSDPAVQDMIIYAVTLMSVMSAFYGNIMGLAQNQIKRMIAYSSIAHSAYIFMTILLDPAESYQSQLLFYLVFYSLAATGALMTINYFEKEGYAKDHYQSLAGAFYTNRTMAVLLSIFILSLAGIPLTAGFTTKYLLFANYFKEGMNVAAISLLLSSIIGLGFYIKIVMAIFMEEKPTQVVQRSALVVTGINVKILVFLLGMAVMIGGAYPSLFLK